MPDSGGERIVDALGNNVLSISPSGAITANQGSGGALASFWPVRITDGTNAMPTGDAIARPVFIEITDGSSSASVTGLNALRVAPGMITNVTTLNAVTTNTTGATVAAGSAYSNWSAIAVVTGTPTAGTLTIEFSQDQTNWASSTATVSTPAAGNYMVSSTGRPSRYARVSLTGAAGSGVWTVTMIAAG